MHKQTFYERLWKIIKEEKRHYKGEFVNRKKNGTIYYEDKTISPILNKNGEITNYVSIGRDITEAKKIQLQLKESERRFRNILESVNIIALQLDLEGNIVFANQKLCDLTLCRKYGKDIKTLNWFEHFIPDKHKKEVLNIYKNALKNKKLDDGLNYTIKTFDGQIKTISWVSTILFDENKQPIGIAALGYDITKTLKLEKQLKARTKFDFYLEKRNKRKTIKNIIKGQELERKRISKDLHDGLGQQLVGLKIIANSVIKKNKENNDKLTILANQISEAINEVRRISYNLLPSVLSDFGLIAGIEKVIDVYEENIAHIKFELTVTGKEKRLAEEVELALFRIFQEALNNAVKHAKTAKIDIHIHFSLNEVNLIVQDYGVWHNFSKNELKSKSGNGILNIMERAEMINAQLNIVNNKKGTQLKVKLDL